MRTKLMPATALGALFAAGLFVAPTLAQATNEQAPVSQTSQKDGVGAASANPYGNTSVNPSAAAPSAPASGQPASFTSTTVSNGPVPDTPENRAKYGAPMSNAGKRTAPSGN